MGKAIEYIQVTLRPYEYAVPSRNVTEIRIEVRTVGEVYNSVQILDRDDFTSHFDYLMDRAKREVLKLIQDQETHT